MPSFNRTFLAGSLAILAGCSAGGDPLEPPGTGGIALVVNGLPAGIAGAVTIAGPASFSGSYTASTNIDNIAPGSYTISASNITAGGQAWVATPSSQVINVPAAASRVEAAVTYAVQTGRLVVNVNGLPGGTNGAVTVTGPNGFSQLVMATDTLEPLSAGTYAVTATNVTAGSDNYVAAPASQQVVIPGNGTGTATVGYTIFVPGSVNLRIDGMYLIQSVQSYDDTVPLVANRDAYLRVFVLADQANSIAPTVRVRLYDGASSTLVQTYVIPAPGASVPTTVNQGSLSASWNLLIPGSQVQPNLQVLVDVDPDGMYAEGDETDNSLPVSGTPRAEVVRIVNPIAITLVPVTIATVPSSLTATNMGQFLVTMKKVYALRAVNPVLRSTPYVSSAPALTANNDNGAWGTVLGELNAVRISDGYSGYYYGVVPTSYSSGVAGIGYVPGRAAIGWGRLPSGDEIMAHEFGHNLSLSHAPCGGAGGPDPLFPYSDGSIGVYGLDVGSLTLKAPTSRDLMGYCGGVQWISDYHYLKAFNYRHANPQLLRAGAPREGLLVWGTVTDGAVTLEPAFTVNAPAAAGAAGSYRVQALDAAGRLVLEQRFEPEKVADLGRDERHFALVLPADAATRARIATLRVSGGLVGAERTSVSAMTAARHGAALRMAGTGQALTTSGGVTQLRWNGVAYPLAVIRDAATGEVISLARRGMAEVPAASRGVTVEYSDGVQSTGR